MTIYSILPRLADAAIQFVLFLYFTNDLRKRNNAAIFIIAALLLVTVELSKDWFMHGSILGSLFRTGTTLLIFVLLMRLLYSVQTMYAFFLSMVFIFSWGLWKNVVSSSTLGNIGIYIRGYTPGSANYRIIHTLLEDVFRIVTTIILKKYFLQVNGDRNISLKKMFIILFPAFVNFFTMVILYYVINIEPGANLQSVEKELSYLIIMHAVSSLIILIATEQFFRFQKQSSEILQIEQQIHSQYQKFQERRKMDNVLQMINHDMNNHLNVLKSLTDDIKIKKYINELLNETGSLNEELDTGNSTLNIVLSQKHTVCTEKCIQLEAYINLKKADFISPMDITVLFANGIDNAIEAVAKLADSNERKISIRGGAIGNCIVVKIQNPYCHELIYENQNLATTKEERHIHGIGLNSIKRVLEKYSGTMTIVTKDNMFELKWMIPISETAN